MGQRARTEESGRGQMSLEGTEEFGGDRGVSTVQRCLEGDKGGDRRREGTDMYGGGLRGLEVDRGV